MITLRCNLALGSWVQLSITGDAHHSMITGRYNKMKVNCNTYGRYDLQLSQKSYQKLSQKPSDIGDNRSTCPTTTFPLVQAHMLAFNKGESPSCLIHMVLSLRFLGLWFSWRDPDEHTRKLHKFYGRQGRQAKCVYALSFHNQSAIFLSVPLDFVKSDSFDRLSGRFMYQTNPSHCSRCWKIRPRESTIRCSVVVTDFGTRTSVSIPTKILAVQRICMLPFVMQQRQCCSPQPRSQWSGPLVPLTSS